MTLTVVHLFPRRLNLAGDLGNASTLVRRARWRGVPAELVEFTGGRLPAVVDVLCIGSGPLDAMRDLLPELLAVAPPVRELVADGLPVLAVGGGWQLLGEELRTADGERIGCAAVLPSRARLGRERLVGETAVRRDDGSLLMGFANHAAVFTPTGTAQPLGRIAAGPGTPGVEGLLERSMVATTLHGPVLPMNPVLADAVLDAALDRRGLVQEEEADPAATWRADDAARRAREEIGRRLRLRDGRPRR